MFESILCQVTEYDPDVLESLIGLAVEIAREGREGRRVGTLFTLGDEIAVLARSRPLILDPLSGHPESSLHLTNLNLRGTIKELAQLDGGFVVSREGIVLSACRYLDAVAAQVDVPLGLGSRHIAAANPGAPDSQLTGINNFGETAGVYDLGSLASTQCPGPSCGAISFFRKNGKYTSFQDPSAAPGVTFAQSVNDTGQIAGFYQDTSGGVFGFLRRPSDGSFKTIQFPFAGNFSTAGQVNNFGVVAGDYQITFPQGYLAFGSHFLSIDYPSSAISGLRAVNDQGEVAGYFAFPGGPVEAYVAIPGESPSD